MWTLLAIRVRATHGRNSSASKVAHVISRAIGRTPYVGHPDDVTVEIITTGENR
jgi:hypothetical protein